MNRNSQKSSGCNNIRLLFSVFLNTPVFISDVCEQFAQHQPRFLLKNFPDRCCFKDVLTFAKNPKVPLSKMKLASCRFFQRNFLVLVCLQVLFFGGSRTFFPPRVCNRTVRLNPQNAFATSSNAHEPHLLEKIGVKCQQRGRLASCSVRCLTYLIPKLKQLFRKRPSFKAVSF